MEIRLKEYYRMFRKRLWLIASVVLLFTVTTVWLTGNSYHPLYQAATKLIINSTVDQPQIGQQQIDFGAIGLNLQLIDTYKEIIKTPVIMDKVVQQYPDLHLTADQLSSRISVSYLNGSQVMTIIAQDLSYERAVKIVNDVSQVFQQEMPKIMKIQNITILNMAKMQANPQPINKKSHQYMLISFVGSFVVAIGLVLFLDSLDDTLKTEDDIRLLFEKQTLAVVPMMRPKDFIPRNSGLKGTRKGRVSRAASQHD